MMTGHPQLPQPPNNLPFFLTQAKLRSISPEDQHYFSKLVHNTALANHFKSEVQSLLQVNAKIEDVLRRFSLNGDGRLSYQEFILSLKRMNLCSENMQELFNAFCPRSGKKLDVDIFCRIIAYWSSLIMKSSGHSASHNEDDNRLESDNTSSTKSNGSRNDVKFGDLVDSVRSNRKKIQDLFVNMDIGSTKRLSVEEFELALEHIGIRFTREDFAILYERPSLAELILTEHSGSRSIRYLEFLDMCLEEDKAPKIIPAQKIWDVMVLSVEKLEPLLLQYTRKTPHRPIAVDILRECLKRCGIALSNSDFTALLIKLQPLRDRYGDVKTAALLDALHGSSQDASHNVATAISPRKTRRKALNIPMHAAGKSNEERNAGAQRLVVKVHATHNEVGDFGEKFLQSGNDNQLGVDGEDDVQAKLPLEKRILRKLNQFKVSGAYSSLQAYFPCNRFGRITRGQFWQSLAHLGVVARYAEVEKVFWELDPDCHGFVLGNDLYGYLESFSNGIEKNDDNEGDEMQSVEQKPREKVVRKKPRMEIKIDTSEKSHRGRERLFECMLDKAKSILQACQRLDTNNSGSVTKDDFIWALKESGFIVSNNDANMIVHELSARRDGVVYYQTLEERLMDSCSSLLSPSKKSKLHSTNASITLQHRDVDDQVKAMERMKLESSKPAAQRTTIDLTFNPENTQSIPVSKPKNTCPVDSESHQCDRLKQAIDFLLDEREQMKFSLLSIGTNKYCNGQYGTEEVQEMLGSARLGLQLNVADRKALTSLIFHSTRDDSIDLPTLITRLEDLQASYESIANEDSPEESEEPEHKVLKPCSSNALSSAPASIEVAFRRKLSSSRLAGLDTMTGLRTAGVVLRHAFRGKYDHTCRDQELRQVLFQVGLDLTHNEYDFMLSNVDPSRHGVVKASDLLQFFLSVYNEGKQQDLPV